MCGRFARYSANERFAELFDAELRVQLAPSFNVAPSQKILCARPSQSGQRELVALRWGLIPSWSKGPDSRYSMINARAESAAQKPAYRRAFKAQRCLIASDGFFEWQRRGKHKQPYFIYLVENAPFAMAGLWESWHSPAGELIESCTILTTDANEAVVEIHDRMPVILAPEHYASWLDPATAPTELQALLQSYPAEFMLSHPVSTLVNRPANDSPDCLIALKSDDPIEE